MCARIINYFKAEIKKTIKNKQWLPTNLKSLSHLSLFVFVKQTKTGSSIEAKNTVYIKY